jgi:hypothetical protein
MEAMFWGQETYLSKACVCNTTRDMSNDALLFNDTCYIASSFYVLH